MKLKHYGMLVAGLGLLASCSNDNLEGPNQPNPAEEVGAWITLDVREMGTRTTSPNNQTEPATTEESTISSVILILADSNDTEKIAVKGEKDDNTDNWKFAFTGDPFKTLQSLPETNVYVVCNLDDYGKAAKISNPTSPIQRILSLSQNDNTYWKNNNFLMSNYQKVTKTIDIAKVKNGEYATTPLDFGTIEVQRTMARLDVAKDQPKKSSDFIAGSNIEIEFKSAALVNVSKKFFLYKEVGGTSEEDNKFSLFAKETVSNYVNDPKMADNKYEDGLFENVVKTQRPDGLQYSSEWGFITDSEIGDNPQYAKLSYVTPNTVTDKDLQKNGKSTGIVFKAQIKGATVDPADGNNLYTLDGVVLGDLTTLKNIVERPSSGQEGISGLYKSLVGDKTNEADVKAALTTEAAKNAGFKIYPKDEKDNNFYCYYYYWVRHNASAETNNNQQMHAMEFGVVRNNVYKIAVTSVKGLGEPADFEPNPDQNDDPVKPTDKTSSANINVSINVKPWEKRVDNVEF